MVERRCLACHREDGVAPFALTGYEKVRAHAKTIREVVGERRMPPWHADRRYGRFTNDRSMPDAEVRQIGRAHV